jgi:sRNA-binding protein
VRARLAQNFNALLDFVSIDDGELHGTAPSPSRARVQAAPESGDVTEELARIAQQARQARDAQQAANAAQAEAEAEAQAAAAQEAAKAARMQAMKEALANARATSGQNEEPADDPQ